MAADLYPHSNHPLEEMMGNLKLDPSTNSNLANMEASPSDATSCISSTGDAAGSFKEREVDHEPLTMPFSATNYYGYYYPGYTGSLGGPDDQGYYLTGGGLEIQYPVVQADNGSLIYFMPGFQPGYNSYTPFLPAAAVAFDGQYPYQHPYPSSSMFPLPAIDFSGNFPTHIPYGSELVPSSYLWDTSQLGGDGAYANGYAVGSDVLSSKSASVNGYASGHTRAPSKSASDSKNTIETKGVSPALISSYHGARNQLKGFNKASQHGSTFQPEAVVTKGYFPITKFPPYHHGKGGWLYPNSSVNVKANARVWSGFDKLKTRNKTNGISDFALLNEQHHGPRTANAKNALVSEDDAAVSLAVDVNKSSYCLTSLVGADQYNLPNFSTKYEHAFFFVIKSYSEDDIHKSIKYSVWASTPNGNKRLDSAYQEAQGRMEDKGSKCPVFLFFSVNASGQFCGVAEMIGRVDFSKSVDFWQQDKWNGSFPVKWHIIKDIPNPQIRHIILENNDNKPVTNSRDTQEVRFPQGIELLSIFKNNVSKTSILDDFEFYESRQKVMQEKRIRPSLPHFGGVQKAGNLNPGFQATEVFAVKDVDKIQIGEKTSD